MFARSISISKESTSNNINLNSDEFFEAINKGDIEKVKTFFYDPNFKIWQLKDENNYTALHFSVLNNNYELTEVLIEQLKKGLGMSSTQKLENFVNEKNKDGITALHFAVRNGNIKLLKLLKQLGANLEAVTNTGKNIMHIASGSNQPSMLLYLFLYEAQDISSVDENGSTPLHWACYYSAEESVNYLLNLKVDINAQDKEKFTPLHLAVNNNAINIVKLLLQKGADKKILNNYNELPIDIARKKNYIKIYDILAVKEFNPYCTLELPSQYIKPSDSFKKIIFLMIIIPEIIILFLIIPFLESYAYFFINIIPFALCLLNYIILLGKEPGYLKNKELLIECGGEADNKPLKKLIENGSDLKGYCPTCYVLNGENKKHCFICDKCVLEMSHHCFWLNKCIGKKNKVIYIIFLFSALFHAFFTIFISLYLIFDNVIIPYQTKFLPDFYYLLIDRGFRVLGANIVFFSTTIITLPIFFLFMIEMCKLCGLLGNKPNKEQNLINDNNQTINNEEKVKVELQSKKNEPLLDEENGDNSINNDENEIDTKINIPNENFPLVDNRPSETD